MYIWGAIFTISYANIPCSSIFISSSMSAMRKAPGMLHIPTLHPSCTSIVTVISTDSVDTVGEVASPVTAFLHCLWKYAHVQTFNITSLSTFKKISDSSASHFCYSIRCLDDLVYNVSLMWIWDSSSVNTISSFNQVDLAHTSEIIAWMHMQSLMNSQLSPQNVTFLCATITTMNHCLGHSQIVKTTSIDWSSPSRSNFASVVGDCIHSSPLVA